jgi:GAF domain-containing protein
VWAAGGRGGGRAPHRQGRAPHLARRHRFRFQLKRRGDKIGAKRPRTRRHSPGNEGKKARGADERLSEALRREAEAREAQAATGEILRVISSSPGDAQPVFAAIVDSAGRLCGAESAVVYRFEHDQAHFAASYNVTHETVEMYRRRFPRPLRDTDQLGRVADGSVLNFPDVEADRGMSEPVQRIYRARGVRSAVWVPMVRAGQTIGAISVAHRDRGAFSDARVQLLQTFADQAVIAIENVRLFRELEDKSRQLETASQHKSEFLANMSHELRTPLNAVIGFSEVLAAGMFGAVNDKQAEYLRDILESGHHLLSLINDILDLSKVEAGRMDLELGDFDAPSAVDNALALVRERALRRGISLRRNIDGRVGAIRADERKIKQVLLNLLSNALKFTPEGGPRRGMRGGGRPDAGRVRHRYRRRHRAGGSGRGLRGVSPGGDRGQEGGGHRPRTRSLPEVRGAARRPHRGDESGRGRVDLHVHHPGAPRAERPGSLPRRPAAGYLTVTLLARFRGLSGSWPRSRQR